LIGSDPVSDVAVLKISSKELLPFVELKKNIKPRIGENIMVIGNPYGLGVSVSYGIVSAVNRGIEGTEYSNLIQTDAAINKGNSGGAMFDLNGNVVGITSVIFSESGDNIGLGFAIPISDIIDVVEILKTNGYVERGYLAMNMLELDSVVLKTFNLKKTNGVLVVDVFPGSTAEKSGILPSDIIISIDNKSVRDLNHINSLLRNFSVGYVTNVLVFRNGETVNLKVKIEELPYFKYDVLSEKLKNNSVEIFDMYLAAIDKSLIDKLELHTGAKGLMVLDVKPNGLAELNGIDKGDIILTANQTQLRTKQDLLKVLEQVKTRPKDNRNIIFIVKKYKMRKNTVVRLNFNSINF
jgi:serine protease Do